MFEVLSADLVVVVVAVIIVAPVLGLLDEVTVSAGNGDEMTCPVVVIVCNVPSVTSSLSKLDPQNVRVKSDRVTDDLVVVIIELGLWDGERIVVIPSSVPIGKLVENVE